jgi:hypothetical protein
MESLEMYEIDDKDLAIIALLLIALAVLYFTRDTGLDVVTNVVCAIGGIVTGKALSGK